MIDIGDILSLPKSGELITQGSVIIHEIVEQYQTQAKGVDKFADAHKLATAAESRIIGLTIEPDRHQNIIQRPEAATGHIRFNAVDGRSQSVFYKYNNNITVGSVFNRK